MSSGNEQGDERKRRPGDAEQRRQQMGFEMMHAERRYAKCESQRVGDARADEQCAGEPRPLRVSDPVELGETALGFAEHAFDQRYHAADVIARG